MIDVTLLGTSALLPLPERALTAAVLTCCGRTLLFDCGEGTQIAARRCGVSLMTADIIALTHYHGDHILGIPGLLQTMFSMGRTQKLYIVGPRGLEDAMKPILQLAGWLSFPVCLMELPPRGVSLAALIPGWPDRARLAAFPTVHRGVSQGYVFSLGRAGKFLPDKAQALGVPVRQWRTLQRGEAVTVDGAVIRPEQVMEPERKGLSVVFSGDTTRCDALVSASQGADLLICEATYGETEQEELAASYGHMTFLMAAETAAKARAKRLWLAHFSQRIENPADYLPIAQAVFPPAQCGEDGLRLALRFEE
ncbi:MAG: ribonuclease Z [Clostridiales bacterium]|nr:ribonuclease Z [Clostridiales bacterium]